MSSVVSSKVKMPVVVTMLREGYVIARAWPDHKYCGFDIHLWGSFEKQEGAKRALITAVGSSVLGPSSSSYRVVAGGMFGVSTWKEDEKNRGPKLAECVKANATAEDMVKGEDTLDENIVSVIVNEGLNLIRNESDIVVAVLCGQEGKPCLLTARQAVKRSGLSLDGDSRALVAAGRGTTAFHARVALRAVDGGHS